VHEGLQVYVLQLRFVPPWLTYTQTDKQLLTGYTPSSAGYVKVAPHIDFKICPCLYLPWPQTGSHFLDAGSATAPVSRRARFQANQRLRLQQLLKIADTELSELRYLCGLVSS